MEAEKVHPPPPPPPRYQTILWILFLLFNLPSIFHLWQLIFPISIPSNHVSPFLHFTPKNPISTFNIKTILFGLNGKLEEALAEAATEDKTVIIAYMREGDDRQLLDLFLDGLWLGEDTQNLKDHLLIATANEMGYHWCMFYVRHCYLLGKRYHRFKYKPEDISLFLAEVLAAGYNFIFTETDVLWLRNPFPMLLYSQSQTETIDLQFSVDKFNGNQSSEENLIDTGFYMARSNYKTISLFCDLHNIMSQKSTMKEQDGLRKLIKEGGFKKLGLKVRFLNTLYFSGFCEDSKDVRVVATVHANCCHNMIAKVKDLTTVIKDWSRFTNSTGAPFKWSKHKNCKASRKGYFL